MCTDVAQQVRFYMVSTLKSHVPYEKMCVCVRERSSTAACIFRVSQHNEQSRSVESIPGSSTMTRDISIASPDVSSLPFTPILPFPTPSDLSALYELGPELGRGQFGVIRRCKSFSAGTFFACKSISKLHIRSLNVEKAVVREVLIMKKLSVSMNQQCNRRNGTCADPGVVRLHDVVEDSGFVHLIMDLCEGGDLFDRITRQNRYTEARAACIMRSLLEALQLCHGMGIVHRDLKPENILFLDSSDASPIKLADFGLALEFTQGQQVSGMAGSTFYVAPEVLQGLSYSTEIDMWSAGVILYVMLSGTPPFWEATEDGTFKAIQQGNLNFPPDPWAGISHYAKDLVLRMLCSDVESRLTTAQALNHPWIVKNSKRGLRAQPHRTWSGKRL